MLNGLLSEHYQFIEKEMTATELDEKVNELYVLVEGVFATAHLYQDSWPIRAALRQAEDRFELSK